MKSRRARIIAWGLCAIAVVSGVVHVLLVAGNETRLRDPVTATEALFFGLILPAVFSVLAALIIARQPANRVGWLMMIVALAINSPVGILLERLSAPPATMTAGLWLLLWLDGWSWIPFIFPIFLIPLYFPTGQPPSPRWRWIAWLALGMWAFLMTAGAFSREIGPLDADWTLPNPIGLIPDSFWEGPFIIAWGIGLLTTVIASVVSLFVRYRRADSGERQQIKWLLFAGAFFALIYSVALPLSDQAMTEFWFSLLFLLSVLGIPIAIAVAIFRYRLWDLEVVVNRAVIYGLLTTLLAGLFAAVIAVITEAGKDLLGEGSRAAGAAISALIVAVVFQPLRTWIENGVNRRFYPEKHDLASGMVEVQPEYWAFLDQPSLVRISLKHVRRVLGTPHAAFFLATEEGGFRRVAADDTSVGGSTSIWLAEKQRHDLDRKRVIAAEGSETYVAHAPVYVDRGKTNEVLGLLSIGSRASGKGYSGDDLKGLADLGGKIGLALNAIQLGSGR